MRIWSALWVLPALLLASCGPSDGDLNLSLQLSGASLKVTELVFGSDLSGSFVLHFSLGEYAPNSTELSQEKFEVQTEAGVALADLRDAALEPPLPITLKPGESKQSVVTLAPVAIDGAAACAGPLRIVGSVMDSQTGSAVPVRSGPITPDCG